VATTYYPPFLPYWYAAAVASFVAFLFRFFALRRARQPFEEGEWLAAAGALPSQVSAAVFLVLSVVAPDGEVPITVRFFIIGTALAVVCFPLSYILTPWGELPRGANFVRVLQVSAWASGARMALEYLLWMY